MAGIRPRFERGSPLSFNANVLIKGGQLVEPDGTTGRIKPTAGASAKCLGVATGDASAYGYTNANTQDAWGNPIVNATFPPNEVSVANQGVYDLKATGAISFGDLVVSAANGTVSTVGANTFDKVIGRCVQTAGIADGAKGKILLRGAS